MRSQLLRCMSPFMHTSIVHLVAAGFGVSIVPRSIEQIRADGIVYVPIKGEAPPGAYQSRCSQGQSFRSNSKLCRSGASAASGTRLINALHRASVSRTAVGTKRTCPRISTRSAVEGRPEVSGARSK
jgi:hypothetical protein